MPLTKRQLTVLILVIVIVIVAVMASSLSNLEFKPGKIVPGSKIIDSIGSSLTSWAWLLEKYETVLKLFLLLAPVALIVSVFTPRGRRTLITFAIILIAIFFFRQLPLNKIVLEQPKIDIQGQLQFKSPQENTPMSLPKPPGWLVFVISIIVSVLIIYIGFFLWYRFKPKPSPLTQMAEEVKKTIEDLRTGTDIKEGVLRCYSDMSRVINEQRGIKRKQAMTVREFEVRLEKAGLPLSHIERLTRLFEKVRYGAKDLDETEEQEALDCLNSILKACEDGK